jgi:sec-independent protein translocase protein TatB
MFNLDPGKLIVIGVVAIILLGPDKLPQFARQVGGAWRTFNEFRHRMESEVRSSMPDLPPTSEIARLARSPSALLNHLSSMSDDEEGADGSFAPPGATANGAGESTTGGAGEGAGRGGGAGAGAPAGGPSGERTTGASSEDGVPGRSTAGERDTAAPGTNGRSAAVQPTEVATPADPTLN